MNFLLKVKNETLKTDLMSRDYTYEHCAKPTRHGFYIHFKAKGLSPGFTWFIGNDENAEWIEEFLG